MSLVKNPLLGLCCCSIVLSLGVATPASADRVQGFIYGTVETESGSTYTGILRWGKEESFWDDLFNSAKVDLPYLEDLEDHTRDRKRRSVRILGKKFTWDSGDYASSRVFAARFGDIDSIELMGGDEAEITMRNGERYDVEGYANDIGATIHVRDESLGDIDLRWDRIERITFEDTPSSIDPGATRLHGTVQTDAGDFTGFVLWDGDECQTTDELDGDTEDGDVAIEMGKIRAIERRGRRSSIVELRDGRELRLRGSNDVDDSNRGIYVEIPEVGRVKIPWGEFDRVDFSDSDDSGPSRRDFGEPRQLRGTVFTDDDESYSGRLVYDLDEAETWEILNGNDRDLEFSIPFSRIRSIEPTGHDDCLITLRNGDEMRLEDSQDVSDRNDGILVFADDDTFHLKWNEIVKIEFE